MKPSPLFPLEPYELRYLPPGRGAQRTARAAGMIAAGFHPFGKKLINLPGATCGNCLHLDGYKSGRRQLVRHKCGLMRWTHGAATTLRKRWPGCEAWEKGEGDG